MDSSHVWLFNYRLWFHICLTSLAAFLLIGGFIAIIRSIDFLFGTKIVYPLSEHMGLFIATIFSPLFAMTGIPKDFNASYSNLEDEYPVGGKFILSYILMPLLSIYAAVLYAYIAKILFSWDLPKGGVVNLVCSFGSIGIVSFLASYPLHNTTAIIRLFSRYFFLVLIIPSLLLAVGMGVRVYEYGITEDRYAVILCLIWFVLSIIFSLTLPRQAAPKYIYASVIALFLLCSFGPWSAEPVSASSQLGRLKNLLTENGILDNGHISKSHGVISSANSKNISSILDYIVDTKKQKLIKPWFSKDYDTAINLSPQEIAQDMGVNYIDRYSRENEVRYLSYHKQENHKIPLLISGFDYLISPNYVRKPERFNINTAVEIEISFDPKNNQYSIERKDTGEKLILDLTESVNEIIKGQNSCEALNQKKIVPIKKSGETFGVKLIIRDLHGSIEANTKPKVKSLSTDLLIKINEPTNTKE
jgi:hypothetical protein